MKKLKKEMLYVASVGAVFGVLTLTAWGKPADEISNTERRKLAQFPEITRSSIQSGLFMSQLENYMVDQFPLRDEFRSLKAVVSNYLLGQRDNDGVYVVDDVLSKLEYPYQAKAVERASEKYHRIYENNMKDTDVKIYTALIPDKNYFLAEENGYPSLDYEVLYGAYKDSMKDMAEYVEILPYLELEDYYRTDTHWRQECIQDVASYVAKEMGVTLEADYEEVKLETPFYGVYYGQAALPIEPDEIAYMNQELFEQCRVYDYQNQREMPVYDLELAAGRDAYEMFLGGTLSVITIENPKATTDKELVIFRDSFGSSIAPYFIEEYQKITLLDARYLQETLISKYVTFTDQDVLILHSTSVINNESAF